MSLRWCSVSPVLHHHHHHYHHHHHHHHRHLLNTDYEAGPLLLQRPEEVDQEALVADQSEESIHTIDQSEVGIIPFPLDVVSKSLSVPWLFLHHPWLVLRIKQKLYNFEIEFYILMIKSIPLSLCFGLLNWDLGLGLGLGPDD